VIAAVLKFSVQPKCQPVEEWIAKLLDCSYRDSQPRKHAKVLVNPHSGRKKARRRFSKHVEPLLRAAGCSIDMVETRHVGEGISIAEKLDIDAFDTIVVCSGDGLAHEVFNGLGKRSDAKRALTKIAVAHIPCGSANGLSRNLNHTGNVSKAALAIIKGVRKPMDLVSITQGDRITLSYLSQAIGMAAESDLATEYLRWMGKTRFVLGFLTRILAKKVYPAEISVKIAIEGKNLIMEHYENEMEKQVSEKMCSNSRHPLGCDLVEDVPNHPGLPPLKYGTINDRAPEDWVVIPCDNLGTLYSGNVSPYNN
jgi:sphingosine kinase